MITTFYTRREGTIGTQTFPAGAQIARLETPDGIDVNRILRGIANNLFTTDAPAAEGAHAVEAPTRPASQPTDTAPHSVSVAGPTIEAPAAAAHKIAIPGQV